MDLGLSGQRALITGGSKGIGLATAKTLAEEGCNIVLVARDSKLLNSVANEIKNQYGVNVEFCSSDISETKTAIALANNYKDIDILVNNAGAIPGGGLKQVSIEDWRKSWDLKVFGSIEMTRYFYENMENRGKGVIVNVIGWAGTRVDSNYLAGSMGNSSLIAMTRAMGSTSPADNIRVVGVNPGPVSTERLEVLQRKKAALILNDADRWEELLHKLPFGRAATSDELGAAITFLASDKSAYTSGTILDIDGGLSWKM
ncbi:short-chain dehydrogenase/reductase [Amphritea sp. 2_MG-2023]|uniref:short-chain dehydrogenase/reductase n=1 Tax=Amphritea TaxID=515417 RepID=UPI001C06B0B9|nr:MULTISPECIES: short-chain dehydrogenase/reductase [Amphritea]MBU2967311.1 SDR family oxidoreductase [Amphritea atlantica]MDO6420459.1 short-chain dehydrogenase/reductase [Amphritea sp. 2_MG-2023]